MPIIFLLVSFFSSMVGSICGIGGGVIIKPVLDATAVMSVSAISFLSGCTVLSMAVISVGKALKNSSVKINVKITTWLALGSVAGGLAGKILFQYIKEMFQSENKLGYIQAVVMVIITLGTLIYTWKKESIKTHNFESKILCFVIGIVLGVFSSFLGIGGGPINLVVLIFFFSMTTKEAAINSIYIILFSQIASLIQTLLKGTVPDINLLYLGIMVAGGVAGGMAGSLVNKKINDKTVEKLFMWLMLIIVFINIYNAYKFSL